MQSATLHLSANLTKQFNEFGVFMQHQRLRGMRFELLDIVSDISLSEDDVIQH